MTSPTSQNASNDTTDELCQRITLEGMACHPVSLTLSSTDALALVGMLQIVETHPGVSLNPIMKEINLRVVAMYRQAFEALGLPGHVEAIDREYQRSRVDRINGPAFAPLSGVPGFVSQ